MKKEEEVLRAIGRSSDRASIALFSNFLLLVVISFFFLLWLPLLRRCVWYGQSSMAMCASHSSTHCLPFTIRHRSKHVFILFTIVILMDPDFSYTHICVWSNFEQVQHGNHIAWYCTMHVMMLMQGTQVSRMMLEWWKRRRRIRRRWCRGWCLIWMLKNCWRRSVSEWERERWRLSVWCWGWDLWVGFLFILTLFPLLFPRPCLMFPLNLPKKVPRYKSDSLLIFKRRRSFLQSTQLDFEHVVCVHLCFFSFSFFCVFVCCNPSLYPFRFLLFAAMCAFCHYTNLEHSEFHLGRKTKDTRKENRENEENRIFDVKIEQ